MCCTCAGSGSFITAYGLTGLESTHLPLAVQLWGTLPLRRPLAETLRFLKLYSRDGSPHSWGRLPVSRLSDRSSCVRVPIPDQRPQAGGRVPDMVLLESCKLRMDGNPRPQISGSCPEMRLDDRSLICNAVRLAHPAGRVPAQTETFLKPACL